MEACVGTPGINVKLREPPGTAPVGGGGAVPAGSLRRQISSPVASGFTCCSASLFSISFLSFFFPYLYVLFSFPRHHPPPFLRARLFLVLLCVAVPPSLPARPSAAAGSSAVAAAKYANEVANIWLIPYLSPAVKHAVSHSPGKRIHPQPLPQLHHHHHHHPSRFA